MAYPREVPDWVADWIGIPYLPGGRARDGSDCFGLSLMVWRERFGIHMHEYPGVAWCRQNSRSVAELVLAEAKSWSAVPPDSEACGDAILIRVLGYPIHVGVIIAPGWMLHIERGVDSCLEAYRALQWKRRVIGFYRHASLASPATT